MQTTKKNVWIRLAGNAANLKAGKRHGWRCFFPDDSKKPKGPEVPLIHWMLSGEAISGVNFIPGVRDQSASMSDSVVAWIDMFGDVDIRDDILTVALRNPS